MAPGSGSNSVRCLQFQASRPNVVQVSVERWFSTLPGAGLECSPDVHLGERLLKISGMAYIETKPREGLR